MEIKGTKIETGQEIGDHMKHTCLTDKGKCSFSNKYGRFISGMVVRSNFTSGLEQYKYVSDLDIYLIVQMIFSIRANEDA
jgi:hypothetical protein